MDAFHIWKAILYISKSILSNIHKFLFTQVFMYVGIGCDCMATIRIEKNKKFLPTKIPCLLLLSSYIWLKFLLIIDFHCIKFIWSRLTSFLAWFLLMSNHNFYTLEISNIENRTLQRVYLKQVTRFGLSIQLKLLGLWYHAHSLCRSVYLCECLCLFYNSVASWWGRCGEGVLSSKYEVWSVNIFYLIFTFI